AAPWAMNWLHALTAGAFGTMILGVTTRVALGHTGRALVVGPLIVAAYGLVIAGALVRVFGAALWPAQALNAITVAGALWAGAFAIFLAAYLPVLIAPRADA